jgi:hypothetical protein
MGKKEMEERKNGRRLAFSFFHPSHPSLPSLPSLPFTFTHLPILWFGYS